MVDELTCSLNWKDKKKEYSYDAVFAPGTSQDKVFEDTRHLIQSAIDGYNGGCGRGGGGGAGGRAGGEALAGLVGVPGGRRSPGLGRERLFAHPAHRPRAPPSPPP